MTIGQVIALITAVAGVLAAVTALLRQIQQGKTITAHGQRITDLEDGTVKVLPPDKPG